MSRILVKLGLADSMDYAYWNIFNEKSAPPIKLVTHKFCQKNFDD